MKTKLTLSQQEKIDILTNAIETGAISYWACDYGPIIIRRNKTQDIVWAEIEADNQDGKTQTYTLTPRTIQIGVDKLFSEGFQVAQHILQSIISDNTDSIACDAIIQAAIFGELVYG